MKKLNEIETKIFETILNDMNAERQILDIHSEKPLVFHKKHKQLTFVIGGKGFAQVNDKVFSIESGSLILLPENTKHSFLCIEGSLILLHIHFPKITGDEDRFIVQEISEKWKNIIC